jgi:Big-like domain-containing protein/caspase domain-containing protein
MKDIQILRIIFIVSLFLLIPLLSGCLESDIPENHAPQVEIEYPLSNNTLTSIVKITGTASDEDNDNSIAYVEIKINHSDWEQVEGITEWSYDWNTYTKHNGLISIYARAWDGQIYSDIDEVVVRIQHPETSESDAHKWAVFVIAGNYPQDNESKLGNGGLYLAEEMTSYFIENLNFPTDNIFILFDDGWIREDNGYGDRIETLEQRTHQYAINYGGATEDNVGVVLHHVVEEASHQPDSEVFLWFAGHGLGDQSNPYTGGKILERSAIFLWDNTLTDRELGDMLYSLRSEKTCIIVDACFSGGFADKLIYGFPTLFVHSGISGSGRVVMSGASKFRSGYASTTKGPLFSYLWFEGLVSGDADGFQPGFRSVGKPPGIFTIRDGKVSAEEAFYYARYVLREDDSLNEYQSMEPQINDQYPNRGNLRSKGELNL